MSAHNEHHRQARHRPGIPGKILVDVLGGNMFLAFSLIFILFNKGGFFHPADWVFWITVATLVAMRYVDIRFCDGQTATAGEGLHDGLDQICSTAAGMCGGPVGDCSCREPPVRRQNRTRLRKHCFRVFLWASLG